MIPHDPFAPDLHSTSQLDLSFEEPRPSRRIWPVRELVGQVRELVEQQVRRRLGRRRDLQLPPRALRPRLLHAQRRRRPAPRRPLPPPGHAPPLPSRRRPARAGPRPRQRLRAARPDAAGRRNHGAGRRRLAATRLRAAQGASQSRRPLRRRPQEAAARVSAHRRHRHLAHRRRHSRLPQHRQPPPLRPQRPRLSRLRPGRIRARRSRSRASPHSTHRDLVDVIVIARGGGSLEDLAAFNTERVARAIAASRLARRLRHRPRNRLHHRRFRCRPPRPHAFRRRRAHHRGAAQHRRSSGHPRSTASNAPRAFSFCRPASALARVRRRLARVARSTRCSTARQQRLDDLTLRMESQFRGRHRRLHRQTPASRSVRAVLRHDPRQRTRHRARPPRRLSAPASTAPRVDRLRTPARSPGAPRARSHSLSPLAVLDRGYALVLDEDHWSRSTTQVTRGDHSKPRASPTAPRSAGRHPQRGSAKSRGKSHDGSNCTEALWHRRHSAVAGEAPLDAKTIYAVGLALAHQVNGSHAHPRVMLGRDTRESSPWIAATLAAGLRRRRRSRRERRRRHHAGHRLPRPHPRLLTPASSSPPPTIPGTTTASSSSAATASSCLTQLSLRIEEEIFHHASQNAVAPQPGSRRPSTTTPYRADYIQFLIDSAVPGLFARRPAHRRRLRQRSRRSHRPGALPLISVATQSPPQRQRPTAATSTPNAAHCIRNLSPRKQKPAEPTSASPSTAMPTAACSPTRTATSSTATPSC